MTQPFRLDSGGADPGPARRVPSQVSSETGHWLGIVGMPDDMIELALSEVDADNAVHQIFRFETGDGWTARGSLYRTDLVGSPYIGGGGDRTVTSFIDDDVPVSGEIGYEVVAFDFHGNRSSPTSITVDLG